MNTTQQRMTAIFNEWARRYADNPDEFGEILDEMDAAGQLPRPGMVPKPAPWPEPPNVELRGVPLTDAKRSPKA